MFKILLALFFVLLNTSCAHANKCNPMDFRTAYVKSDVVVVGEIINQTSPRDAIKVFVRECVKPSDCTEINKEISVLPQSTDRLLNVQSKKPTLMYMRKDGDRLQFISDCFGDFPFVENNTVQLFDGSVRSEKDKDVGINVLEIWEGSPAWVKDPILALAAELTQNTLSKNTLWTNGITPFISASIESTDEEILSKILKNDFKLLESRKRIEIVSDFYEAFLVSTDRTNKIVLLQRTRPHIWFKVFPVSTYLDHLAAWYACETKDDCTLAKLCGDFAAVSKKHKMTFDASLRITDYNCRGPNAFCGCEKLCSEWNRNPQSRIACEKGRCSYQWPTVAEISNACK